MKNTRRRKADTFGSFGLSCPISRKKMFPQGTPRYYHAQNVLSIHILCFSGKYFSCFMPLGVVKCWYIKEGDGVNGYIRADDKDFQKEKRLDPR